jgi:uncharacterized membrane protein YadS
MMDSKELFFVGIILAASGIASPPIALLAGLSYGFMVIHPYHGESHSLSKFLPQVSVVGLGFGMNLHDVILAGRSGFLYTAISIVAAMALGLILGKLLLVKPGASFLINVRHRDLRRECDRSHCSDHRR